MTNAYVAAYNHPLSAGATHGDNGARECSKRSPTTATSQLVRQPDDATSLKPCRPGYTRCERGGRRASHKIVGVVSTSDKSAADA
jgi:hypothetical protein